MIDENAACQRVVRAPAGWTPQWSAELGRQARLRPPCGARWGLLGSFDGEFTGLGRAWAWPVTEAALRLQGRPDGLKLLQLAGVTHVVLVGHNGDAGMEQVAELQSVFECPIRILRVPDPLPWVYVVGEEQQGASVADLLDPRFDPRRVVMIRDGRNAAAGTAFHGTARVVEERGDALVAEVETNASGLLVLIEAFDAGWRATLDGEPAEVLRANVLFRAVRLRAGRHVVRVTYRPSSVLCGVALSMLGVADAPPWGAGLTGGARVVAGAVAQRALLRADDNGRAREWTTRFPTGRPKPVSGRTPSPVTGCARCARRLAASPRSCGNLRSAMNLHTWRVAALLFASGACALVYQVVWMREFRMIFGASTVATAAVLAIFVGCLGAGSLLIGSRAERRWRQGPLHAYWRLEGGIAASVAVTPLLLDLVRWCYVATGGTQALGFLGGTMVRLVLSAGVLAVPTLLMGGTLPVAALAVASAQDARRRTTALLYGFNTLGAALGALASGFFMLEVFGTRRTLWLACLVNGVVAVVARHLARTATAREGPGPAALPQQDERTAMAPRWFVLWAAGLVGFVFFAMELVWYRMLGPILGGTVYTFALILCSALLGIALGGILYAAWRGDEPATLCGLAWTCALESVAIAAPLALGDRIAVLAHVLRPLGAAWRMWGYMLAWGAICALVVVPAAIVAGYQFPLLVSLLGRGSVRVSRHIGQAYAANTGGAILGSLAGGFGLLPLLGAPGAWRAMALALVALALGAAIVEWHRGGRVPRRDWIPLTGVGLVALAMANAVGPTAFWRHAGIGAGRAIVSLGSPNTLEAARRLEQLNVLWEADGVESSVALMAIGPGLSFVLNGKSDGNARGDAATVVMGGLVGAALHPEPRRSLVIGLGAGSTAGWLAALPGMERTDVIELEPNILRVARACASVNQNLLANPRVHIVLGDAREALLVSRESYDIIFSEPSNPYRAGVASLFTREYYEAVARRLAPRGVFLQWLQTYEVDLQTVASVYATLHAAFPYVETWQVGDSDLLLMAASEPIVYDVPRLRARLAQEPFRTALRVAWEAEDAEGFLAFLVARASFSDYLVAVARGHVSTDDHNEIEFGFARTVGSQEMNVLAELRQEAARRGEDRHEVVGGAIDWRRLEDARTSHMMLMSQAYARTRSGPMATVMRAHLRRDDAAFLAAWRALKREPEDPLERRLVAGHLSALGDEAALPYIARVAKEDQTTSLLLEALLRARQGRPEAVDLICQCLERMRFDPWLQMADSPLAVALAGEIGRLFPSADARLIAALSQPLALHAQDDLRRDTLVSLADAAGDTSNCPMVLSQVRRRIPWTETWLAYRERCYSQSGGAPWREAQEEVARFLRYDAQHLPAARGERLAPGL